MSASLRQTEGTPGAAAGRAEEPDSYPSEQYAWYVVGVLTLAYVFSFIDRQILTLLVGPIKRDLAISDTQMSLLMGLSFAAFYTLFGIPIGRLADTRSRRAIITAGLVFWSLMTAGCGFARRYWHLAAMRMGVGVGEASLSPAAYSLIADCFRPEKRATAISVYSTGIYLGLGLATLLGGLVVGFASGRDVVHLPLIGATRPWQLVFLVVGLPGLLVAALLSTLREPSRKGATAGVAAPEPLGVVWAYVRDNRRTFLCHNLGVACLALSGYAAAAWVPTLLVRRHHWTASRSGVAFGLASMVCGTSGIVLGGRLADRLRRRGHPDATLRVALLGAAAWLPFGALFPLMPTGAWAVALLAPAVFFSSLPFGVAPAAIQEMMPNPMRGQASAFYLFVINLIGLGLGPTAVALVTDYVLHDEGAVHVSLLVVGVLANLAAVGLLAAGLGPYRRSLDYLAAWDGARSSDPVPGGPRRP
jgi:MFS family permease